MKSIYIVFIAFALIIITISFSYADTTYEEKQTMVDVRQQAMQAMWSRLDRLSTLIAVAGDTVTSSDGSSIVIGNRNKTNPLETYALIHAKEAKKRCFRNFKFTYTSRKFLATTYKRGACGFYKC